MLAMNCDFGADGIVGELVGIAGGVADGVDGVTAELNADLAVVDAVVVFVPIEGRRVPRNLSFDDRSGFM